MNEQILYLAEQAGIAVWGDAVYMYNPKDTLDSDTLKKFAELIVQECARVADIADENKCEWIGGNILTHFGVKE